MKCPHCLTAFYDNPTRMAVMVGDGQLTEGDGTSWEIRTSRCPECERATVLLMSRRWRTVAGGSVAHDREYQVWPKGIARTPLPKEVPEKYAGDYREACNTLADSPKASTALSRRCLQLILRDEAKVKHSDLSKEITEVLASKTLPGPIAEAVDAIRGIGNFAAHPIKSTNTGEIVDVEPGEAEWSLSVIESLFDSYFVQPAVLAAKRAALNAKLADAGKPSLKKPG